MNKVQNHAPWCSEHQTADDDESWCTSPATLPPGTRGFFTLSNCESGEPRIVFDAFDGPAGISIEQARLLRDALTEACAKVGLASPAFLDAIAGAAAMNYGVELAEVATVAGVSLENITVADATELMMTVIHWDKRLGQHLTRTMARA